MAHELSIRADGRAEMAFVGETPWHGLGQSITKGASVGVWRREAGMDWEAKEAPVLYQRALGRMADGRPRVVDSHKVLYRSDTGAPLGIVGQGYNIVQPADVLEFFRDLTEHAGWHIHTAGVLRGGKKLWAMASNGQVDAVRGKKGDQVLRQVLLATSLDGSMKTVAKPCAAVVVCANTLSLALREGGKVVTVSHRTPFDGQAVRRALGIAAGSFDAFLASAREMAETPVDLSQAMSVLEGVFGRPPAAPRGVQLDTAWMGDLSKLAERPEEEDDEPRVSRSVGRSLELFVGGAIGSDREGRRGTAWGLLNAVTEYVDHEMGRTQDSRMDQAWFGRGDAFKQAAFEALCPEVF